MNPTMDQFNALLARVNQLDGAGLWTGSGSIPQLTAQIAGLKQTLNQAVLAMESELSDLRVQVANLQQLYNTLAGVASQS